MCCIDTIVVSPFWLLLFCSKDLITCTYKVLCSNCLAIIPIVYNMGDRSRVRKHKLPLATVLQSSEQWTEDSGQWELAIQLTRKTAAGDWSRTKQGCNGCGTYSSRYHTWAFAGMLPSFWCLQRIKWQTRVLRHIVACVSINVG